MFLNSNERSGTRTERNAKFGAGAGVVCSEEQEERVRCTPIRKVPAPQPHPTGPYDFADTPNITCENAMSVVKGFGNFDKM